MLFYDTLHSPMLGIKFRIKTTLSTLTMLEREISVRKSNKKNWNLQEKGRKDCNKRNKIQVFPPKNLHFSYKNRIFAEI